MKNTRVLLIEGKPGDARLFKELLGQVNRPEYDIKHHTELAKGVACLAKDEFDVIILDLSLSGCQDLDSFQQVFVQGRSVFEPPSEGALVVKANMVWAGPGKWVSDGQILVEDGKIPAEVGEETTDLNWE